MFAKCYENVRTNLRGEQVFRELRNLEQDDTLQSAWNGPARCIHCISSLNLIYFWRGLGKIPLCTEQHVVQPASKSAIAHLSEQQLNYGTIEV